MKEIVFGQRYQTIAVPNLGKPNRNGRIYTHETAKRMCDQFNEPMLGQIGMPDQYDIGMPDQCDVSFKNTSHRIHQIFIVGDDLWAEFSVLNTPCGRLLCDLFQKIGIEKFSLRPSGKGTVSSDGLIRDNYQLDTFNFIPIQEDPFRSEDRLKSIMDKETASIVFNAHLEGGKDLIASQISMGRYVFGFQSTDFEDPIYESPSYQALNIEIDDVDSMIYALKSLAKDETIRIDEAIIVESGKAAMDRAMKTIAESYCMNHLPSVSLSTSSDPMNWAHGDLAGPTGSAGTPGQQ